MSNKITYLIAGLLLIFVSVMAVSSAKDDSLTFDETAHLPAGYSYLTQQDMRMNPEHPPLGKSLAAVPLLFIDEINFPKEDKSWQEDIINGRQWVFGNKFLYKSGNPAEKIIFWGRMPMIAVLIFLGLFVFLWTKKLFNNNAALLALFLYSFSPTLLAHGRLVNTDLVAAAGMFIATFYFINFLKNKSKKNLVFVGIALGIAELLKFSAIILFPFFGCLIIAYSALHSARFKDFWRIFGKHLVWLLTIFGIAVCIIWVVYAFHTWNYPPEKQAEDTAKVLPVSEKSWADAIVWAADKPVIRPLGQYAFGISMNFQRSAGGNTTYFNGEVASKAWKDYFPTVYLIKETITFHLFSLLALLYALWLIEKPFWVNAKKRIWSWLRNHFTESAIIFFIIIYWTAILRGNLNIGVRHLLPTFPFAILLVGGTISLFLKPPYSKLKKGLVLWFLIFQAYSVLSVYPHFIAYFNELAGGPEKGYEYVVDSNLDWGQDLRRLSYWVEDNNIEKIHLDYFGGADAKYYLGEKYAPWWGSRSPEDLSKGDYLAVSATLLQGGRSKPGPGFNEPTDYYKWLNKYQPIKKIGYSIFVYRID